MRILLAIVVDDLSSLSEVGWNSRYRQNAHENFTRHGRGVGSIVILRMSRVLVLSICGRHAMVTVCTSVLLNCSQGATLRTVAVNVFDRVSPSMLYAAFCCMECICK